MFDYEKEHQSLVRAHLAECTVLLKKDGSFPLNAPCRIAAYGSGVRRTVKGGTGSGEVNSRYFTTIEKGLEAAGFTLTTKKWMDAYETVRVEARKTFIRQIKAEAKAAKINAALYGMGRPMPEPEYDIPMDAAGEAAIYVVSRISGEGNDRKSIAGDVLLTASEQRDILALNEKFDKFMLVLNVGGAVDLSGVADVKNILILSQLGPDTGSALADILLGRQNPSGKLTTTWSAWEDYCTEGDFGDNNDTRYKEGVFVGYRYFDSVGKKALFPFGFGLSYTEFSVQTDGVDVQGPSVTVRATVTNTGKRAGKEIVQVYVSAPAGKLAKPYQSLAGFAKTAELAPGGSESVSVCFDLRDISSYDEERAAYILEAGEYIVRVGTDSVHTSPAVVIEAENEILVRQCRTALGKPDFTDWAPEAKEREKVSDDLPRRKLGEIPTETVCYEEDRTIDDAVRNLTDEQLVYANIGAFDPKGGMLSIIGSASKNIAGAAGETTGMLHDEGFPAAVMADGPAGLRLSREFYRDEKGAHSVAAAGIPESVLEYMSAPLRWLTKALSGKSKAPKNAKVEYQYCTMIPIGTALAQSWNTVFAEECGDIVGDEMERFGVHYWLAPALNIHRTILCGRNFEYYSEDPLLSGKFAAAVTRGVQKHPGRGTTVKHFCANNQETNRVGSNSIVSERALREIYLRGFEICVRESSPAAVMTSYNLLNGTHTAERRDLVQDVLRREFGFSGIVMTDWVVGSVMANKNDTHRPVKPRFVAAAGGDLMMPGGKGDFNDMLAGLKEGDLTREQLMVNVTRVYRAVREMVK